MPSIKQKTKGFGNDNISNYFLKLALPYILKSLACMFNKSLEKREFPALWKTARVIPIFKEGDKNAKENYRPISVLPVVSRLFERLAFNQLYQHLNTNDLLAQVNLDSEHFILQPLLFWNALMIGTAT